MGVGLRPGAKAPTRASTMTCSPTFASCSQPAAPPPPRSSGRRRPRAASPPPRSARTPAGPYAGALRRIDAWLDGRALDDVTLALYLAGLHDAGRASSVTPVICDAVSIHSSSVVTPEKKRRKVSYTRRRIALPRELVMVPSARW